MRDSVNREDFDGRPLITTTSPIIYPTFKQCAYNIIVSDNSRLDKRRKLFRHGNEQLAIVG